MYELQAITFDSPKAWDRAVKLFDTWHLYHLGAWLDFIECTQPVTRRVYGIYAEGVLVGYLPGFVIQKGPIRIFGSPLPGWTTPYLGPAVNRNIDSYSLYLAIARTLRRDGFRHAEICNPAIDPDPARRAGFRQAARYTYVADLGAKPDEILSNFSKSTRKVVRRALRGEIHAVTTDDPAFIDHYYDQLCVVFAKGNSRPTYTKQRVQALWKLMMPTGRMLPTMVMKRERCIATRIDLCGNGVLHSFGSASYREFLKEYPNELARYHAMCQAAELGLKSYDMTGRGEYKAKFNA
ncbi:MAG: GNAT family N-acetyltransferase, partial [Gammaproteobacteria bacterium]|nr:GNAT family N-acetyltransferase [Gammaproteobacteria bacterium]